MTSPTQSTPGGCFIGVIAIVPLSIAALGGFGLLKWIQLPAAQRNFDARFWMFAGAGVIGALAAAGILYLSIRVLRATDFRNYDSRDPDNKNLKW